MEKNETTWSNSLCPTQPTFKQGCQREAYGLWAQMFCFLLYKGERTVSVQPMS